MVSGEIACPNSKSGNCQNRLCSVELVDLDEKDCLLVVSKDSRDFPASKAMS